MAESELIKLIGKENVRKLAEVYGGEHVYIPANVDREERNETIKHQFTVMLNEGSTCMNAYQALSSEFCVSPRRIMQIVNEAV